MTEMARPQIRNPKHETSVEFEIRRRRVRNLHAGAFRNLVFRACLGLRTSRWVLFWITFAALPGCGYMVGSTHPADVRTVAVPVFQSQSFRRGFEFQLTEAVHKEIQNRTHFRLAKEPYADSRLSGRIVAIRKQLLGENAFDEPRELQLQLAVEVTWEDLRTGEVLERRQVPISPEAVQLLSTADFAPEVGQSLATARQEAVETLARQIVDMMEMPW